MTSAVANATSAPSPGITLTFGPVPKLDDARVASPGSNSIAVTEPLGPTRAAKIAE